MCQFCVEHGEGKRWYLNAKNYSYDLESDLRRREYIHDFISGFDEMRANAVAGMELLGKMPGPFERAVKSMLLEAHAGTPLRPAGAHRGVRRRSSTSPPPITVIPCICRMHAPGQRAEEVCMLVTTQPIEPYLADGFKDYAAGPDLDDFHRMEKAEAMQLLRECEDNGLMHSIWTFQTPFAAAICNCNLGERLHGDAAHQGLRDEADVARRVGRHGRRREVHVVRPLRESVPLRRDREDRDAHLRATRRGLLGVRRVPGPLPRGRPAARRPPLGSRGRRLW